MAWPRDLPARVVAVRDLLAELGEATAEDVSGRFKGVQTAQAEKLESLAAVGVAIEMETGGGVGGRADGGGVSCDRTGL